MFTKAYTSRISAKRFVVVFGISLILASMLIAAPRLHYAAADSSVVQSGTSENLNYCGEQPSCTASLTLASSVTSGNVLVVGVAEALSGQDSSVSVSDSLSSSFTEAASVADSGQSNSVFIYTTTLASSGSDTITVTDSTGNANDLYIFVFEVAGVSTTLAQSSTGSSYFYPNSFTGTISTSRSVSFVPGAFLLAVIATGFAKGGSAGSGFACGPSGCFPGEFSEYATSSASSPADPTNFPASLNDAGYAWDEAGIALQPLGVTTTVTSTSTSTATTTVTATSTTTQTVTSTTTSVSTSTSVTTSTTTQTVTTTSSITVKQAGITLQCASSTKVINHLDSCKAKAYAGTPPAGTITFSVSGGTGVFSDERCSSSGNVKTCSVYYKPTSIGEQTVTATYSNDPNYASASASYHIKVVRSTWSSTSTTAAPAQGTATPATAAASAAPLGLVAASSALSTLSVLNSFAALIPALLLVVLLLGAQSPVLLNQKRRTGSLALHFC